MVEEFDLLNLEKGCCLVEVGIFFFVNNIVISDKANLDSALNNEFFIEHGEHYNFWLSLRPKSDAELYFKSHAYDYFPRGRVVFDKVHSTFYLYADCCLKRDSISKLIDHFGLLNLQVKVRRDEHYQCGKCGRYFIDDL